MSFFNRLLGKNDKTTQGADNTGTPKRDAAESKFMPSASMPVEERFIYNFQINGGRFLYCTDMDEVQQNFNHILQEHDWNNAQASCFSSDLCETFARDGLEFTKSMDTAFFLTTCEYLIAIDGSILVSARQIAEKRMDEVPDFLVVLAGTSQLAESLSEGLRNIKRKYPTGLPTNITSVRHFKRTEDNYLTYGSVAKTAYLLLLEDL